MAHRDIGPGEPDSLARQPEDETQRHLDHVRELLSSLRGRGMPYRSSVVWPAGLSRQVLAEMSVTVRTDNCLRANRFLDGSGDVTVQELMHIPNFGRTSLKDMLLELERYLAAYVRDATAATQPMAATQPSDWDHAAGVLRPLLAAAAELKDVETIGDALSPEIADLARKMGLSTELESIRAENLAAGTRGPIAIAVGRLEGTLLALSPPQRIVVEHRLLRKPPKTLSEVGDAGWCDAGANQAASSQGREAARAGPGPGDAVCRFRPPREIGADHEGAGV